MDDTSLRITTSLPGDLAEAARRELGLPEGISPALLARTVFAHAAKRSVDPLRRGPKPGNARNKWMDRDATKVDA